MKRIKAYVTASLLLASLPTIAQQKINKYLINKDQKWYDLGDKVEDVTIERIRNYPTKTARISDFQGKLLVLDFWDKGCTSCIANFPKMEALQKEFGNKIQILLVCKNNEEELKLLFKKSPNAKAVTLPMPLGDTILNKLFPHIGVPYHVWIGPDGKVVGMTDGTSTNSTNIKQYLETGKVDLPLKKSILSSKILNAPIVEQLLNIPEPEKYLEAGVFIMKKHPNIALNESAFWPIPALIRIHFIDVDESFGIKKVVVEVRDSLNFTKYFPPVNVDLESKWRMENAYKIQISSLPDRLLMSLGYNAEREYIKKYLKDYVLSHFGITYSVENRKLKCWVITRINNADKLKSKGRSEFVQMKESDDSYFSDQMNGTAIFRNTPFGVLLNKLNKKMQICFGEKDAPPLLNETGYNETFKVDMDLRFQPDLVKLNGELALYGLHIKEAIRNVKCLSIKEL
ncbi:MAG TPA: TlpA disulfide reductase family protein [Pedobacter sp.]|uniref:TlpA family protein disulfide reductase n=1 Tax=Pedobacter sp. TaxID=1411316 RepID=UPI002CA90063|nr:TlpA disulfide reductase family protein [Pedobacter sp.]HMI01691.1 TlpA disulfide reductase family protein [Pedobacter sp.]